MEKLDTLKSEFAELLVSLEGGLSNGIEGK